MTTLDPKSPTEEKLYTFDLSPRLAAKDTTITSIVSIVASVGTVLSNGIDATSRQITALLGDGAAGDEMKVTATYITADGQTLQAAIDIPIRTV